MVEVDIQTVSIVIASVSIVAGVVYYALELRHQASAKQMDLIMRLHSMWVNKVLQAMETIRKTETKNYKDFEEKCPIEAQQVAGFFDNLGLLLRRGLIDIDLISQLFILEGVWKRMKIYVEGIRERTKEQRFYGNFEYLYNEWKKREQKQI